MGPCPEVRGGAGSCTHGDPQQPRGRVRGPLPRPRRPQSLPCPPLQPWTLVLLRLCSGQAREPPEGPTSPRTHPRRDTLSTSCHRQGLCPFSRTCLRCRSTQEAFLVPAWREGLEVCLEGSPAVATCAPDDCTPTSVLPHLAGDSRMAGAGSASAVSASARVVGNPPRTSAAWRAVGPFLPHNPPPVVVHVPAAVRGITFPLPPWILGPGLPLCTLLLAPSRPREPPAAPHTGGPGLPCRLVQTADGSKVTGPAHCQETSQGHRLGGPTGGLQSGC